MRTVPGFGQGSSLPQHLHAAVGLPRLHRLAVHRRLDVLRRQVSVLGCEIAQLHLASKRRVSLEVALRILGRLRQSGLRTQTGTLPP